MQIIAPGRADYISFDAAVPLVEVTVSFVDTAD